jgi:cystine transport system substrate-binding protein
MKNRIFPALAAGVLALTTLTACGGGQPPQSEEKGGDLLAAIQAKGEIVVAMEGTWAPWTYHDEAGELVGYDVEVAQAVAEELGVKVSFAESGWDSLLAGLESGRYDIIVNGVEIDEARQEKFDFSVPYAYNRTAVIVRGDNEEIQSMEDLEGKQTANTISSTYAAVAQKYGAEVTGVDDLNQTFELLTSGRIDATLNADVSYHDYMRAHPEADIKIACLDPDPTQVAIPMRKGEESAALREAIDKALTQLSEDGTLTELSTKYFGVDISQK